MVETYVRKAEDLDGVNTNLIPGLLDAILGDYNRNVPAARDAEVLNVMATIVSKLGVSSRGSWSSRLRSADYLVVPAGASDRSHTGRSVRANAGHDQPGLCRVPRASSWFLQDAPSDQPDLLPL